MNFLARLRRHLQFGRDEIAPPACDLDAELARIEQAEASRVIPTGRLIHAFVYDGFGVRLDRDMTGAYRVTVHEGGHRLYSFTIVCPPGDYRTLQSGYDEIIRFLSGSRSLRDLPNLNHLRGHYYGEHAPNLTS